ncbi:MAG TPA: hypothetical protein ENK63_02625, partial [Rhodobacterales bacterium]|nr:hypothetical protein [Rhodobacterales bacterium]
VVDSWIVGSLQPDQRYEGVRLDSLRVTSATEGTAIPRVFARMRLGGNIIWATDFTEHVSTTTQGGGKGGGPKVTTSEYSYSASFAVALCGLTQIRRDGNAFPGENQLKQLAAEVRSVLGPGTKISYAADWSEYFGYHPDDGSGDVFFNLDKLWADANIDFIGIDNYMPLSDWRDGFEHADAVAGAPAVYDRAYLQGNIAGGEGFDWFYASQADRDAQIRTPITDGAYGKDWVFRYKDLESWWSNPHYDRPGGVENATPTAWTPQSKPIRFTEFGCPAIDRGTNQPNVFYDPKSSESAAPYFSRGWRDDAIQRAYLEATALYWADPANNPVSGTRMDVIVPFLIP